ncbi:MAG: hypothetical protein ACO1O6_10475 [Bacteroidota bacterium]
MKKIFILVLICSSIFFRAYSQQKWSKEVSFDEVQTRAVCNESNYYMIHGRERIKAGPQIGQYKVMLLSSYDKDKKMKEYDFGTLLEVSKKKFQIQKLLLLGGSPVLVYTRKEKGTHTIYAQKFSEDCQPDGQEVKLHSYSFPILNEYTAFYDVNLSPNKKYLSVRGPEKELDDPNHRETVKVFDENLALFSERAEKPILPSFLGSCLTNKGAALNFYAETERLDPDNKWDLTYKNISVRSDDGTQVVEGDFKKHAATYFNYTWKFDDQQVLSYVTAYRNSQKHNRNKTGFYLFVYDVNKRNVLLNHHLEFEDGFIKSDEKRREKGGLPFEYTLNASFLLNDNSHILVIEHYTPLPQSSNGASGKAKYKDLLVLKLDAEGEILWHEIIQKEQSASVNEERFASAEYFVEDNTLSVVFNDDISNYDSEGNFIENNPNFTKCVFSNKSAAIALVNVDLKTGEMSRRNASHEFSEFKSFMISGSDGVVLVTSKDEERHLILKRLSDQ